MIILVVNRSIIYYSSILFELQRRSDCSLNQLKKDGCSPYEISGKLKSLVSLLFCYLCLYRTRASSPGCCGGGGGGGGLERKESLQVRPREILISASKKSMRNADWRKSDSSVAEVELKVEFQFQRRMQL